MKKFVDLVKRSAERISSRALSLLESMGDALDETIRNRKELRLQELQELLNDLIKGDLERTVKEARERSMDALLHGVSNNVNLLDGKTTVGIISEIRKQGFLKIGKLGKLSEKSTLDHPITHLAQWAGRNGHIEVLVELIEAVDGSARETVVAQAVSCSFSARKECLKVLETLMDLKALPHRLAALAGGVSGGTRLLASKGYSPDDFHDGMPTPLHQAARMNAVSEISELLEMGFDVNGVTTWKEVIPGGVDDKCESINGMTALGLGAFMGNEESVRELLSAGADPRAGAASKNAFDLAVKGGWGEIVRDLISHGCHPMGEKGCGFIETPLASAVMNARPEALLALLDSGMVSQDDLRQALSLDLTGTFGYKQRMCTLILMDHVQDPIDMEERLRGQGLPLSKALSVAASFPGEEGDFARKISGNWHARKEREMMEGDAEPAPEGKRKRL